MQIKEEGAGEALVITKERNDTFRKEKMDIEVHTYCTCSILIYMYMYRCTLPKNTCIDILHAPRTTFMGVISVCNDDFITKFANG